MQSAGIEVRDNGLMHPATIALLTTHLQAMHANSPPESVHALDLAGLAAPSITFYTAWGANRLLGCGALKEIDPASGEVKSMRTDTAALRQGVAARILDRIIGDARGRGYRLLLLETGTGPAFDPALALYARFGFTATEPFGDYRPTDFNRFLSLSL